MTTASQVNVYRSLLLTGWMSERELIWLAERAREVKTIVEFGSFHGRSTRAMADNIHPHGIIWAVDPWNGDYFNDKNETINGINTFVMPIFKRNLADHIQRGVVIPVRTYSHNFMLPQKVDMVFLDGDHRADAVESDIWCATKLLKQGGLLCGHDYGKIEWPNVKLVVDKLLDKVEVEDTIWYTREF